ncbi:RidA family protein [Leifsonia kafniensis]|uniref:RidA family protein n=1 Tax=Leifsonia kafniensis TaxID=475957 RepID=A0ABP7KZA5_9MICO
MIARENVTESPNTTANTAPAPPAIEFYPSPTPRPFSQAVRINDVLYLSGELGIRADGTLADGFEAQAHQTMQNIAETLRSLGAGMTDVFKATIMLDDMSRWAEFNAVYLEYFDAERLPSRSAFGSSGLALGAHLEVECWAYVPALAR